MKKAMKKIKKDSGASQLATAKIKMQSDRRCCRARAKPVPFGEKIPFAKEEWAFS